MASTNGPVDKAAGRVEQVGEQTVPMLWQIAVANDAHRMAVVDTTVG